MKKSLTKNYIYNLIYQILALILPIITAPYVSRVLGAENIGIYSYTLSISAYFILFGSLGIALYGQREIAYKQKSRYKRSRAFWEILILRTITMAISLLIFHFTFATGKEYQIYYKILILEIIGNCFDISWFFQGMEEFKKTVTRNTVVKLISVICIFVFVKTKNDLHIYFIIYVLSILIGNLSLWLYLPKYIKNIPVKQLNIFRHLKPTISLFIPQIAIQVYTLLDRTMVGAIITDKSEVGYYDQGQKIIKMLLTIVTSLGTVMLPRIASTFASGKKEEINTYMKKSFNMVFLIAFPLMFGIIAVSKAFVPVFFGPGYDKVIILMSVISPIILLIGLSNVTGTQYLLPTRRQKEYTTSVVCGAIINLVLNSFLIWKYGAIGASIGTVIAELTVTSVQIFFTRKDFHWTEIIKTAFNYFIASLLMFIICLIIDKYINRNFASLITQVLVGGLVYIIVLLILKDKMIMKILYRVKKLVHTK